MPGKKSKRVHKLKTYKIGKKLYVVINNKFQLAGNRGGFSVNRQGRKGGRIRRGRNPPQRNQQLSNYLLQQKDSLISTLKTSIENKEKELLIQQEKVTSYVEKYGDQKLQRLIETHKQQVRNGDIEGQNKTLFKIEKIKKGVKQLEEETKIKHNDIRNIEYEYERKLLNKNLSLQDKNELIEQKQREILQRENDLRRKQQEHEEELKEITTDTRNQKQQVEEYIKVIEKHNQKLLDKEEIKNQEIDDLLKVQNNLIIELKNKNDQLDERQLIINDQSEYNQQERNEMQKQMKRISDEALQYKQEALIKEEQIKNKEKNEIELRQHLEKQQKDLEEYFNKLQQQEKQLLLQQEEIQSKEKQRLQKIQTAKLLFDKYHETYEKVFKKINPKHQDIHKEKVDLRYNAGKEKMTEVMQLKDQVEEYKQMLPNYTQLEPEMKDYVKQKIKKTYEDPYNYQKYTVESKDQIATLQIIHPDEIQGSNNKTNMHGLSVDHMIKLLNMTTLDHILDKYEIQVIEHNDETPIIPNRNIIWIFIKKNPNPQVYHFTILVLQYKYLELDYYDSLATQERFDDDYQFIKKICHKSPVQFKFKYNLCQKHHPNQGNDPFCGFYDITFVNKLLTGSSYLEAIEYSQEDEEFLKSMVGQEQNSFPMI